MNISITEFNKIAKDEWVNYNSKLVHNEDYIPFNEWLAENDAEYRKKYGIYRDHNKYRYLVNNDNFKGSDICSCCDNNCILEAGEEICNDCISVTE